LVTERTLIEEQANRIVEQTALIENGVGPSPRITNDRFC
jgi:hypothetical protein